MALRWNSFARPGVFVACLAAYAVPAVANAANDDGVVPERPTFASDVLPILQRSCQTCHWPNMFTPMSLLAYDEVRPWARSITQRVEARIMPPWFADHTVGVYRDDPSLSEVQIATIGLSTPVTPLKRRAPERSSRDSTGPRRSRVSVSIGRTSRVLNNAGEGARQCAPRGSGVGLWGPRE